jgi:hypothetical protein
MTSARPFICRPDERETAHHECGHIIALWRFGLQFRNVRIWRDEHGIMQGQVRDPDNRDLLALAVACLSGPLARQKLLGNERFETGDGDDLQSAHLVMSHLGLDGVDAIKAILPFARLLVAQNWPNIERVAGQLLIHRMLNFEQVVELIARYALVGASRLCHIYLRPIWPRSGLPLAALLRR